MKIKSMTAVFGKLTGQRLALAPGFNLIEAPNEGGKSTWAAFLKAMLYGIDTRDRDKKGYLADKNRYQPWSGAPMEGESTLEWQGRDVTIRRFPKGNTPFGTFEAVYTGTQEPVPGLTGADCGELLLGVGREVFERSAFLGQSGSLAIQSTPELERRIAALVSSGEEDVSYSQAEGRLKEWLNRRKVNKSVGRIPQLEGELAQVKASREELEQLTGALNALAADTCGELLLGVGREVFERSAFFGQSGSLAIQSAPELEKRIAALVSSGEEDVSYSQAEGRLKEWLNRRKVNKSVGRIPQLEGELAQVRASREELEQLTGALNALAAEERGLRRKKEALEAELSAHKRLAQRDLDRRFTQAKGELDRAQADLDALRKEQARFGPIPHKEELKRAQGELAYLKALEPEIKQGEEALAQAEAELEEARSAARDDRFPGQTVEEAAESVKKAEGEYAAARKNAGTWALMAKLVPVIGVLAAGGMAVLALAQGDGFSFPAVLTGILFLVFTLALGVFNHSQARRSRAWGDQVLDRFSVKTPEELKGVLEDYRARAAAADQAAQQVRLVREGLSDRQARRENSRKDLFDFVHSFAPEVKDLFGCSAALSRALNLGEREAVAHTKLEGARRLYDALKAQGGRVEEPGAPEPEAPRRTMEETAALLGTAQADMERTGRALSMALGRQKAVGDPAALAVRQEELEGELERRSQ